MAQYTLAVGFLGPGVLKPETVLPIIAATLPAGWTVRLQRQVESSVTTRITNPQTEETGGLAEGVAIGTPSYPELGVNAPEATIRGISKATEFLFSVTSPGASIATPGCSRETCPERFAIMRRLNDAAFERLNRFGFQAYGTGFRLRPEGERETQYVALAGPPVRGNNTGLLLGALGLGLAAYYFSRK